MNDDDDGPKIGGVVDLVQSSADGSWSAQVHGPGCERTRGVKAALRAGQAPPHPNASQARCGPVKVNSEAFRTGWEGIFGKKPEVGLA